MRLTKHLESILHLHTVVEQGSINRAAATIGLSQPALTRSIKRLEDVFGAKLLDRTARGVIPTPFGELLVNHARLIDNELQKAGDALQMMKGGVGGHFSCGATVGALTALFPKVIPALLKDRPKLKLRVIEGVPSVLLGMVRRGELDVAVCTVVDNRGEPDLIADVVANGQIDFVVRREHPLLASRPVKLRDLVQSERWIIPTASGAMYPLIRRQLEERGLAMPTRVSETSSITMMRALLVNTNQIAVTTLQAFGDELESGALVRVRGDWSWPATQTIIYCRRNVGSTPLIRLFARLLRAAVV